MDMKTNPNFLTLQNSILNLYQSLYIKSKFPNLNSNMKQEMLKSAKPGTAQKEYQLILDDGTYIDLDPSMSLNPAVKVKEGQRVLVSIITEN
jgi:hypothetical protein